ncbi:MAG TPA: asparagine synthase (glutamine-hydrolyzing) [Steroidobacteraceae bacterium]|jgi:asparagine synthase (glutamine-hydrolysing)|nr:asparagine synthase (glutamine-hydrolyzing) [Steroidobacteraceae bacterium]
MCGIAGIVALAGAAPDSATIQAMCDAIRHRGPDDAGYFVEGPVALGMRRLAIIDLVTGHQPIFNEDRTACIVFNGEIYNYRELRDQLIAAGHRFATHSDTEVIIHLWEQYGTEFAERLNGMFAVAIWDLRARKLLLARDHVGIKPLYYARGSDSFVFGSEVKALLACGRVGSTLEIDALGQFLAWEYVPGTRTMMKEIRRLGAGQMLELDLATGKLSFARFWRVPQPVQASARARSPKEWADELDATIAAAVRRQMIADVPLGAFLSGGVDSSLVVHAMGSAHSFSIGFEDPSYDETQWSKRVAEHLGVNHEIEIIQPQVRELFELLMQGMDDPIGDFSIFPTYLVSRLARRQVTVALSGDGGDELFGGYDTYDAQQRSRLWRKLPLFLRSGLIEPLTQALPPSAAKKGLVNKAKRFVEGAALDERLGHARWRLFAADSLIKGLLTPMARAEMHTPIGDHILALHDEAGMLDERDKALYVDLRSYLVDNCLIKVDRMSMLCSLEVRVPLLDREVVDLAFRMPSNLKYRAGETKILLKQVAARHVPRECVYRSKQGFSIPIKNWLKEQFRPLLNEYLDRRRVAREGIFNPETIERLRAEHDANIANHSHLLWGLLMFSKWRELWKVTA